MYGRCCDAYICHLPRPLILGAAAFVGAAGLAVVVSVYTMWRLYKATEAM